MSKLKELTWENHQKAERTKWARKLLKGMEPKEYYEYLSNQWHIYRTLESLARRKGVLEGIEDIQRTDAITKDMLELETEHGFKPTDFTICPVVGRYASHIANLDRDGLLAHIYVRHFGDMYGGQMIAKRNPTSGKMYEFYQVEMLKTTVRNLLKDDMAEEANRCFEFAMELFEELDRE